MAFQEVIFIFCALTSVSLAAPQQYQQVALDIHNQYRSIHHVDRLTSNEDLNNRAVQCAQYYANKGTIDHSCPYKNGAGENLWARWPESISDEQAAQDSTNSWYSEERLHDYNQDWQPDSGHFTQLVWRNSRELGFGTARAGSMLVGCALYSPAGNYLGQFRDNVLRP